MNLMTQFVEHIDRIMNSLGFKDGLSYFHKPEKIKLSAMNDWYFTADNEFECLDHLNEVPIIEAPSTQTHYVLNTLLETANININRPKEGYRFSKTVKSFAVYLRMLGGRTNYQTLHANLSLALPSLSTTDRLMNQSCNKIIEGVLRTDELLLYLKQRNQPLMVSLSEDATRIDNRIQYDRSTNQLIGFTLPLNKHNGMPIPFAFKARSAFEMLNHFSNGTPTAKFVNTVMAKPIGNCPAFCVLIFSSNNEYSSIDVSNRWEHITNEMQERGISVITISSDSDPKFNAAMRRNTLLGTDSNLWPNIDWFRIGNVLPPFYIQDYAHILTKLRNLLLKTFGRLKELPFGRFFVEADHLQYLVDFVDKSLHRLTYTMLNSSDRQNVDSAVNICSSAVINALEKLVDGSEGTVMYLKIMNKFYESFTNPEMSALDRVKNVWYSMFMVRFWRESILSNPLLTLANNFMSSNCYACLELNSHSLVCVLVYLKESDQSQFFVPVMTASHVSAFTGRSDR